MSLFYNITKSQEYFKIKKRKKEKEYSRRGPRSKNKKQKTDEATCTFFFLEER